MSSIGKVRLCSQRNCERTLPAISKTNICNYCTTKLRSRRSFSAPQSASNGRFGIFTPSGELSEHVSSFSGSSLALPAGPGHVPSSIVPSQQHHGFSTIVPPQSTRLVRVLASTSGIPMLEHFNSRGELIQSVPRLRLQGNQHVVPGDSTGTSPRICYKCTSSMPRHYIGKVCPSCWAENACPSEQGVQMPNKEHPAPISFPFVQMSQPKDAVEVTSPKSTDNDTLSVISHQPPVVNNGDTHGDVEMKTAELTHPEVEGVDPSVQSGRATAETSSPKESSQIEPPNKRQKLAHVIVPTIAIPPAPPMQPTPLVQPTSLVQSPPPDPSTPSEEVPKTAPDTLKPKKNVASKPPRALKLCSSPDCTGIVFFDSSATRCLQCVKRDWKSMKAKRLPEASQQNGEHVTSAFAAATTTTTTTSEAPGEKQRNKKKSVTWADRLTPTSAISEESGLPDVSRAKALIIKIPRLKDIKNDDLPLNIANPDCKTVAEGIPSFIQGSSKDGAPAVPAESKQDSPELDTKEEVPLARPPTSPTDKQSEASFESNALSSTPSLTDKMDRNVTDTISGWDSDLSELTDSTRTESEVASDEAESDKEDESTTSGFKIRIPARPTGIYSRKCGSPKCNQLLPLSYRWKSCVMCRARGREYQRRRQNLKGRHTRLDEELARVQNTGPPLPGGFLADAQEISQDPVTLIAGARLCSVRDCTYIIPPVSEYRWKMCALCRLRRRERKRLEKVSKDATGTEPETLEMNKLELDPTKALRTLAGLPKRGPVLGRCQSVDCGVVLKGKPTSSLCKQCMGRQLWLVKESGNAPEAQAILRQASQAHSKPHGPTPYPQYKCFVVLLADFKNRLNGFLKGQALFYLFKSAEPKVAAAKTMFAFDGEYSIVAVDFDIVGHKDKIDGNALKMKREFERVGRVKFHSKRLVSVLDGGGVSIRFVCNYQVPILQPMRENDGISISTFAKTMQGELEIAVVPDRSHRFLPGHRTIIRFRLLG
ncbi:unnamed protein product [Cyclocybe aegerita]|uniref:Uncharacterized protein n=1 Tax=Cyclocybe aegerita TaxID=1973307 RepID=A0A8S0WDU7_CYCAE|nr:unnamed protein product [Cyclocybe aegerita]